MEKSQRQREGDCVEILVPLRLIHSVLWRIKKKVVFFSIFRGTQTRERQITHEKVFLLRFLTTWHISTVIKRPLVHRIFTHRFDCFFLRESAHQKSLKICSNQRRKERPGPGCELGAALGPTAGLF